jgi:uncharacterized repeat protein (TIGR01451 family)
VISKLRNLPDSFIPVCFLIAGCLLSIPASAISLTYVYRGNHFDQFEDTSGIFSSADRVMATFTVDCSVAHTEGDCSNLPYDDYFELGAIDPGSIQFSAGPAMLPKPDGSVIISRFIFSTDGSANIKDWDIELFSEDPFQNIDTDNVGGGIDSAAALGGAANNNGLPGTWGNEHTVTEGDFDLAVEKWANIAEPTDLQQLIYFTISVTNQGPGPVEDVFVVDSLPTELQIPEGLAAYPSVGYYDPESGRWDIGEMNSNLPETLEIPVVINGKPETACILNTASVDIPGDIDPSNNSAATVLHIPDRERCIDLYVYGYNESTVRCPDRKSSIRYGLNVRNNSADPARNVVLNVAQIAFQAPDFRGESDNCDGLVCTWEVLEAEQRVAFASGFFTVKEPLQHSIQAVVSSDNGDYQPDNNKVIIDITLEPTTVSCQRAGDPDWYPGSGVGGGCFIATAIYGSDNHPYIKTLREFRDEVLMRSAWGNKVVKFYYRHAPSAACFIEEHEVARKLAKGIITPLVLIITYPWRVIILAILAVFLYISFRHAGRKRIRS